MSDPQSNSIFAFASPHEALEAFIAKLPRVGKETVPLSDTPGRVLAESVRADRDNPPHDVSAMDGYAVRSQHVQDAGRYAIVTEIAIGQPPPDMPEAGVLKITTGACVPVGCDGVIPREQVSELTGYIDIQPDTTFAPGQHIRWRGENMRADAPVLPKGIAIHPPAAAALAAFGCTQVNVYRPVRVAVLTTGNELLPVDSSPEPWQIRDSNSATLESALAGKPWVQVVRSEHLDDNVKAMTAAFRLAAEEADLVITTGGVSMGDHDYVKPALLAAGGEAFFHKLPIRPGKPILAGLLDQADPEKGPTAVLSLPGNPVSVAVGISVFVTPVARALAGFAAPSPPRVTARLNNPPERTLKLWQYLPALLLDQGRAERITTMGSGDLASAAVADGYIEIPPDQKGQGPWHFYGASI